MLKLSSMQNFSLSPYSFSQAVSTSGSILEACLSISYPIAKGRADPTAESYLSKSVLENMN